MNRSTFMLIAAIAFTSFFTETAVAQFKIPKIKIPKITTNVPSTTNDPSSASDTVISTSNSSSNSSDSEVRGHPIPGARITFSNNPDGSNPKTTFSSSEYIYGRLDLGGKTVYDAFGLKNLGDAKFYYINYGLQVWKPGEEVNGWGGPYNSTLLTKEETQKTYWNFDVLPDPARASTRYSPIEDELERYKWTAGMNKKVSSVDNAREAFPQSGTYNVDITVYGNAYDDWGKRSFDQKDFPTISANFAFQFNIADGKTLVANATKAQATIESAKNASETLRSMPAWWAKGIAAPDPRLAPARLVPMIKDYMARWGNLTYLKHMIYPVSGPMWAVEKNDLGIPRYRRFTSAIYIIYKDPKDSTCQLGYLEMSEPYAGGGTYSTPELHGISDVKYIDCAAVK